MKYTKNPRIILIPYPAQGHVTPMQKLASIFLHHGFDPVIVLPRYVHQQIVLHTKPDDEINWVSIPDGLAADAVPDFFALESAMENNMPAGLEGLVHKFEEDGELVCLVVVDLLASWAIEMAHRCGVAVAGFWPAMLATFRLVAAAPNMVRTGLISETGLPQHEGKFCFLPGLPLISTEDLPWLIGTTAAKRARFKFWTRTLERSRNLKWLLVNSFPEESNQKTHFLATNCPKNYPQVFPIGPLCRYISINNSSFWEEDVSCLDWLDTQKPSSVVYISFGSWVSPIGETKVKSLALALEASKRPFIWVLKSAWREGLPNGFLDRISKQGKVVSWVPQTGVLRHKSVGCYITHCGWNSTMEAIQFKKRMLCYPVAGDQFLNSAYIVQIWRIGLKLQGLGEKEVKEGISRVMEDEEIEDRLVKLSERVMGMQDDSEGASNLNVFMEDLKKEASGFNCTHDVIVC